MINYVLSVAPEEYRTWAEYVTKLRETTDKASFDYYMRECRINEKPLKQYFLDCWKSDDAEMLHEAWQTYNLTLRSAGTKWQVLQATN